MNEQIEKAVRRHIFKDIFRVIACILAIVSTITLIAGYIYGSYILAQYTSNNYLYLCITDGVLALTLTLLICFCQYEEGDIKLYPYLSRLWGRIIYPIANTVILLSVTLLIYKIITLLTEEPNLYRAGIVIATLTFSLFFKIGWFLGLDPINRFFEYVDKVREEETKKIKRITEGEDE